jgi:hypothetical protein
MSDERPAIEEAAIDDFLSNYFPKEYTHDMSSINASEEEEIDDLVDHVEDIFPNAKGYLGLALDFLMIIEELSKKDSRLRDFEKDIDLDNVFDRYKQAETAATLTLEYGGERAGIRTVHERITDLFREDLKRSNFPSAAPHYTGEWERYDKWLANTVRLSRAGRYEAAQRLFDIGLDGLEAKTHATREPPYPEPFLQVINDYRRKDDDEEAGSAYQAIAYGYVKADWSHLSITASKLRTGSSRQHRYGDVDGFYGPDLMISVEAKDKPITEANVHNELGTIMELAEETTVLAIAMCRSVGDEARLMLNESGVEIITDDDIRGDIRTWDYHKQNRAIQGMVHFLANIEENPSAVKRLLEFVKDIDPNNSAMAHLPD